MFGHPIRIVSVMILTAVFLGACAPATPAPAADAPATRTDLSGIKTYLLGKAADLKTAAAGLKTGSDRYYELAEAAGFDYTALWASRSEEVGGALIEAKSAWLAASPLYEQMEGIVAGTPSLAEFDVILDAGTSVDEDPEGAVPFDLTLPDGRVLAKPGNLFGVLESTLWGTYPEFTTGIAADLDANGDVEFGETLPDANVLKAGADALDQYVNELDAAARAWEPTESDAFTEPARSPPSVTSWPSRVSRIFRTFWAACRWCTPASNRWSKRWMPPRLRPSRAA
jgi:hypothetical protein